MMELLFALQMTRGTVFPRTPLAILERIVRRARLAVVTVGRGFYPSAAVMAYAPPASKVFRFRPHVLLAYANVLEVLAREALAGRLRLGRDRVLRQVINMSEPLSEGAKRLISEAFGLPVTNNYATYQLEEVRT